MKEVYKNWPRSFIAGLDFLRSKDDIVLEHPVYLRRTAELFTTLSSGVMGLAAAAPDLNFTGITRDALYDYHRTGRPGDPELDFIIATANVLSNEHHITTLDALIELLRAAGYTVTSG